QIAAIPHSPSRDTARCLVGLHRRAIVSHSCALRSGGSSDIAWLRRPDIPYRSMSLPPGQKLTDGKVMTAAHLLERYPSPRTASTSAAFGHIVHRFVSDGSSGMRSNKSSAAGSSAIFGAICMSPDFMATLAGLPYKLIESST